MFGGCLHSCMGLWTLVRLRGSLRGNCIGACTPRDPRGESCSNVAKVAYR